MNYLFKNVDELKEAVKNSYEKLEKNISKVKEIQGEWDEFIPFPDYALKQFENIDKKYKNLDELSEAQLRNLFRDIKYTSSLKSAHEENILDVANKLAFKDELNYLSPKSKDKFWDLHKRLVSEHMLESKFKYESFSETLDLMFQGADIDSIFELYATSFDEFYELKQLEELEMRGELKEHEKERLEMWRSHNVPNSQRIHFHTIKDILL